MVTTAVAADGGGSGEEALRQAEAEGLTLLPSETTAGFKNVYFDRSKSTYAARLARGGKSVYLGSFASSEEAALCIARDVAVNETPGEEALRLASAEGLTLLPSGNRTGFKCFKASSGTKPYKAEVCRGGKKVFLGWFTTPEEAALRVARVIAANGTPEDEALQEAEVEGLQPSEGFKGIGFDRGKRKPYAAQVILCGKTVSLGSFIAAEEVAQCCARDAAAATSQSDELPTAARAVVPATHARFECPLQPFPADPLADTAACEAGCADCLCWVCDAPSDECCDWEAHCVCNASPEWAVARHEARSDNVKRIKLSHAPGGDVAPMPPGEDGTPDCDDRMEAPRTLPDFVVKLHDRGSCMICVPAAEALCKCGSIPRVKRDAGGLLESLRMECTQCHSAPVRHGPSSAVTLSAVCAPSAVGAPRKRKKAEPEAKSAVIAPAKLAWAPLEVLVLGTPKVVAAVAAERGVGQLAGA